MKRALLLALLAVGCTPTVILGTLSLDAGGGTDFAGCPVCDFAFHPLDGFLPDGDFGGSDLGDGGLVDLAH
ncbi:MAG: hypothetical protein ACXVAN_11550 [Polyangia bacterium]